jgi:pyruvate ferredoxin oxidoreductase alpha subunit
VRLPVLVNMDGFYLSFTREPVEIPDSADARAFLPPYDPENVRFRASEPISQAVAVMGGGAYSYFRYEMHRAAEQALEVYGSLSADFERHMGRGLPVVETHRTDDAEIVFFMIGSFATKARDAVDRLREAGWPVGLVRPRLLRPYPATAIREALEGVRGVAVVDQNLSMGYGGVLFSELAGALSGRADAPRLVSFVGGLGGRDLPAEEFFEMAAITRRAVEAGESPPPRLLYTEAELREVRRLQGIATAERHEIAPGRGGAT